MSEYEIQGDGGTPERNLTDVQQRFVNFVVAKAGVEFSGGTAVTVYDVLDGSLVDFVIFEQHSTMVEEQPDSINIGYSDGIGQEDLYNIDFSLLDSPNQRDEPYSVIAGGNAEFNISDKLAERKLAKLEKLDKQGRLKENVQATDEYKRLYLGD